MKKIITILIFIILILITIPLVSGENHYTRTPIKHVINIYFENNAFDTIFGIYPHDNYSWNQSIIKNMSIPNNLISENLTDKLNMVPNNKFFTENPIEGYTAYYLDWNKGKLNNFVNGSGPQSMVYFSSVQFGLEWSIASEYAIGDMYFSNYMSESAPNTLLYLAGYTPVFNDYGPPPYIPFNETIFGELTHYNISWGIYVGNPKNGTFDYSSFLNGWNIYKNHLYSWNDFIYQVETGTLPNVSYIFTQDFGDYDQHPPNYVERGEIWLANIIESIEKSILWNSSTVFITYDEFGGFYDHIPPPTLDGIQLGMRVPFIVVSPYAKENYVSHTILTHTSLLAFIDYNWNIPALNKLVSDSNIPLDIFNFEKTYFNGMVARPPIDIFSGKINTIGLNKSIYPQNVTINFSYSFPLPPQFQYFSLPYERYGSSNITLSSLGFPIFILKNTEIMPIYFEPWFLIMLLFVNLALITLYYLKRGFEKVTLLKFSTYVSIVSTFLILTIAYSINLIYLIGDERQEFPLFLGIILGSILFSYGGMIAKRKFIPYGIVISLLLIMAALLIILYNSFVINNTELFLISFMIISPLLPIVQLFNSNNMTIKSRILFSTITFLIFMLFIFTFSIAYTLSSQTILPIGVSIFGYVSIILSIALIFKGGE
ncbi:MAG: alkaline phosphatase family protein [Thermoplasmata archaeon]